jgi:hypothetical protein
LRTEAEDRAERDDHDRRDRVAHDVAEQRTGDRSRLPDRERAESIVEALGNVRVQPNACVHGDEHDRLHQNAWKQELNVRPRRSRQRAAEQEREHQRHHQRKRGDVEKLKWHVLDLERGTPSQRERG